MAGRANKVEAYRPGCTEANYTWCQTKNEIQINFEVSHKLKPKRIEVHLDNVSINVTVKGYTILAGELYALSDPDSMAWFKEGSDVEITFSKLEPQWWGSVVLGHQTTDLQSIFDEEAEEQKKKDDIGYENWLKAGIIAKKIDPYEILKPPHDETIDLTICHYEDCGKTIYPPKKLCSLCHNVAYCSTTCQRIHWNKHKISNIHMREISDLERCGLCTRPLIPPKKLCSICHKVAYCTIECQQDHWKVHKESNLHKNKTNDKPKEDKQTS